MQLKTTEKKDSEKLTCFDANIFSARGFKRRLNLLSSYRFLLPCQFQKGTPSLPTKNLFPTAPVCMLNNIKAILQSKLTQQKTGEKTHKSQTEKVHHQPPKEKQTQTITRNVENMFLLSASFIFPPQQQKQQLLLCLPIPPRSPQRSNPRRNLAATYFIFISLKFPVSLFFFPASGRIDVTGLERPHYRPFRMRENWSTREPSLAVLALDDGKYTSHCIGRATGCRSLV